VDARVFLIERLKPNIDVTPARQYGHLTYVFDSEDRRSSVFNCQRFGIELVNRLKALCFDPSTDYLCLAGSLIPVALSLSAIALTWSRVQVLLYSATETRYVIRDVGKEVWRENDGSGMVSQSDGPASEPVRSSYRREKKSRTRNLDE